MSLLLPERVGYLDIVEADEFAKSQAGTTGIVDRSRKGATRRFRLPG
jgi:hypothetical protein